MKRRKRELRSQRIARAREVAEVRSEPGVASDFIWHLAEFIEKYGPRPVVLHCRISKRDQHRRGNLAPQVKLMEQIARENKLPVLELVTEVESGWRMEERGKLVHSIEVARANSGFVLAETTCRLIRSSDFHHKFSPDAVPSKEEFEYLAQLAGGVPLVTHVHPDTPYEEVRSHQTTRGQAGKNRKGGRPRGPGAIKRRRQSLQPKVRKLYAEGKSYAEIVELVGVPRTTIRSWINK